MTISSLVVDSYQQNNITSLNLSSETTDHFNPLSPNIHIQILQTDLYTFPLIIGWENLFEYQSGFRRVIISFINFHNIIPEQELILLGENWC